MVYIDWEEKLNKKANNNNNKKHRVLSVRKATFLKSSLLLAVGAKLYSDLHLSSKERSFDRSGFSAKGTYKFPYPGYPIAKDDYGNVENCGEII